MPLDGKYDFTQGKYDKQTKDSKDRRLKDGPSIDELLMVLHELSLSCLLFAHHMDFGLRWLHGTRVNA